MTSDRRLTTERCDAAATDICRAIGLATAARQRLHALDAVRASLSGAIERLNEALRILADETY